MQHLCTSVSVVFHLYMVSSGTIQNLSCSLCGGFGSVACEVYGLGEKNASLAVRGTELPLGLFDCSALDAYGLVALGAANVLGPRSWCSSLRVLLRF